jgi:hypothetical protein
MISVGWILYGVVCLLWWIFTVRVSCYRRSIKYIDYSNFWWSLLNLVFCPISIIVAIVVVPRDFKKEGEKENG